ncbi:MAG: hypothetical protein R3C68_17450 [Myxococcota bacterium]
MNGPSAGAALTFFDALETNNLKGSNKSEARLSIAPARAWMLRQRINTAEIDQALHVLDEQWRSAAPAYMSLTEDTVQKPLRCLSKDFAMRTDEFRCDASEQTADDSSLRRPTFDFSELRVLGMSHAISERWRRLLFGTRTSWDPNDLPNTFALPWYRSPGNLLFVAVLFGTLVFAVRMF